MVNLTTIAQGRKPLLIYGVKRGKVPTKLRPHMLLRKEMGGKAQCVNEMTKLMACWKSNGFEDTRCTREVNIFMDCVSKQLETSKSSGSSSYTQDEVNATLKQYTPYLTRSRGHKN
ncbi:mitochondrial translation [Desmophyllum pertusum]|uniref:Mitochondrial translation n=1 Tax=Desmophyllum pertusum TaxID=174260 RepID=A0A9X0A298_9CNID|nr:mitochondrial translation [Desmophyllum pertusum]